MSGREGFDDSNSANKANKVVLGEIDEDDMPEFEIDKEEDAVIVNDEDADGSDFEEMDEDDELAQNMAFRPGKAMLEDDEEMDFDPSVYDMFHRAPVGWPCLSFDVIQDKLGLERRKYPHTAYVVAGTQADTAENNQILVMKWSKMHKTKRDGIDSDMEDSDDESTASDLEEGADPDEEAIFEHNAIRHPGSVNRLTLMPGMDSICATWSDRGGQLNQGAVHVWNIKPALEALDNKPAGASAMDGPQIRNDAPLYTFDGHVTEGFALRFSPHQANFGMFLSGSCGGDLAFHMPAEGGWKSSLVEATVAGGSSVEDIAFHRFDSNLFATGSTDGNIRLWDIRTQTPVYQIEKAHGGSDVNVLEFSPHRVAQGSFHLLSGGDDGSVKVWDVRKVEKMAGGKAPKTILYLQYHRDAVTSVAWSPYDAATLASAGRDHEVCVWDSSVEADLEAMAGGEIEGAADGDEEFPPQLMFQHIQSDPKEIHWHPNIPCTLLSTGEEGFHIFRPYNIDYDSETLNNRAM